MDRAVANSRPSMKATIAAVSGSLTGLVPR